MMCKLRKGEFCEVYFFMNKGLAEADSTLHSVDDEALAIVQDKNGLYSFIPAAMEFIWVENRFR